MYFDVKCLFLLSVFEEFKFIQRIEVICVEANLNKIYIEGIPNKQLVSSYSFYRVMLFVVSKVNVNKTHIKYVCHDISVFIVKF